MTNAKIREALAESRFYQYELADWLGVSEGSFTRLMRKEMPEDVQEQAVGVIEAVKKRKTYNSGFFLAYRRSQDRRCCGSERSAEARARWIQRGLDEAERRRIEGGWDLSL